jgi:hypothetical protein
MNDFFVSGFIKTLWILKDYLPVIVIGGGWAPYVYHRYVLGNKSHEPIRTRDIDLMVPRTVPVLGEKTVDQVLVEAGFEAVFKSRDIPPVIHYEGNIENMDVEIEFLADQTGSNPEIVLEVQKGLHAEALRFISIVVENVAEVTIDDAVIAGQSSPLIVKVPTPAAYMFHKGLVFRRRKDPEKKAKDLYYIFDILKGGSKIMPAIMDDFDQLSRKYPAWFKTFIENLTLYFQTTSSEGVLCVTEQRPPLSLEGLNVEQFRQFVLVTFTQLLKDLGKSSTP